MIFSKRTKTVYSIGILFLVLSLVFPFSITQVKAAQLIWTVETVDAAANVGQFTSLALDSAGSLHVSYWDQKWDDLKYAKLTGSTWTIMPVDTVGSLGYYGTSIKVDSVNNPHISYYDLTNAQLKYARWTGSSWSIQTVDSITNVGLYSSLALDSNNRAHISYYDHTNAQLKYARWTGSYWEIQTVDSTPNQVGLASSLELDSNDRPHIAYWHMSYPVVSLRYAHWSGSTWSFEIIETGEIGSWSVSLVLDMSDNPHISYYDGENADLKYATKTESTWTTETVDASQGVGSRSSLSLDSNGFPHIAYYDHYWDDLKYAKLTDQGWFIKNVDNEGLVGDYPSLIVDSSNHPHIVYYDLDNGNLKYARDPAETFESLGLSVLDSDGDLNNDLVEINFNVDTTYTGTLPVSVHIQLIDSAEQVRSSNSTAFLITSDQPELNNLTVRLPQNAPSGNYKISVWVQDDSSTIEDSFLLESGVLYPPQTSQNGYLTGTVTEQGTGTPLSEITVLIDGVYRAGTNASGQYHIELPAGLHNVTFEDWTWFYNTITFQDVSVVTGSTTTQDAELWIDVYVLELQIQGSGTLNPEVGVYQYNIGAQVEIVATPDPGWALAYLVFDLVAIDPENPFSFTMDSNHVLKAVFIEQSQTGHFQGTVTDSESGSPIPEAAIIINFDTFLTDTSGNFDLELQTGEYDVFVEAHDYYHQETHIGIEAGITIVQNFSLEKKSWTLIIEVEGQGTTDPHPGEHQIASGSTRLVEVFPAAGWIFDHWLLDSVNIGMDNPIPIIMNSEHLLVAVFAPAPPLAVSIMSPENKTYSITEVSLTFTVNEAVFWMGYSLNDQATVTIAGNTTLPMLPDGKHYITVYANDTFDNTGMSIVYFTVLLDTDGDEIPNTTDTDDDGDGLPDTWETTYGLNPLDATDASLDLDGDGLTTLQEYEGNTDPNNALSPFPLWIAGVAVFVAAGLAILVYFLKMRKS